MELIDVLNVIPDMPYSVKNSELIEYFGEYPEQHLLKLCQLDIIQKEGYLFSDSWSRTKFGNLFADHPHKLLEYRYKTTMTQLQKLEQESCDILSDIGIILQPGEELVCQLEQAEWIWMIRVLEVNFTIEDYLSLRDKENEQL